MASKLEKMRLKQAKEREQFEAKKKELEEEMIKQKKNFKSIQNGLKNNEINISLEISSTSTTQPKTIPNNSNNNNNNHHHRDSLIKNAKIDITNAQNNNNAMATATDASSSDNAAFPTPSGPKISDWAYTGAIDSSPPLIKTLEL
jgi:hypothetical protein